MSNAETDQLFGAMVLRWLRGHLRQAMGPLIMLATATAFDAAVDALVPLVSNGLDALPAVRIWGH